MKKNNKIILIILGAIALIWFLIRKKSGQKASGLRGTIPEQLGAIKTANPNDPNDLGDLLFGPQNTGVVAPNNLPGGAPADGDAKLEGAFHAQLNPAVLSPGTKLDPLPPESPQADVLIGAGSGKYANGNTNDAGFWAGGTYDPNYEGGTKGNALNW